MYSGTVKESDLAEPTQAPPAVLPDEVDRQIQEQASEDARFIVKGGLSTIGNKSVDWWLHRRFCAAALVAVEHAQAEIEFLKAEVEAAEVQIRASKSHAESLQAQLAALWQPVGPVTQEDARRCRRAYNDAYHEDCERGSGEKAMAAEINKLFAPRLAQKDARIAELNDAAVHAIEERNQANAQLAATPVPMCEECVPELIGTKCNYQPTPEPTTVEEAESVRIAWWKKHHSDNAINVDECNKAAAAVIDTITARRVLADRSARTQGVGIEERCDGLALLFGWHRASQRVTALRQEMEQAVAEAVTAKNSEWSGSYQRLLEECGRLRKEIDEAVVIERKLNREDFDTCKQSWEKQLAAEREKPRFDDGNWVTKDWHSSILAAAERRHAAELARANEQSENLRVTIREQNHTIQIIQEDKERFTKELSRERANWQAQASEMQADMQEANERYKAEMKALSDANDENRVHWQAQVNNQLEIIKNQEANLADRTKTAVAWMNLCRQAESERDKAVAAAYEEAAQMLREEAEKHRLCTQFKVEKTLRKMANQLAERAAKPQEARYYVPDGSLMKCLDCGFYEPECRCTPKAICPKCEPKPQEARHCIHQEEPDADLVCNDPDCPACTTPAGLAFMAKAGVPVEDLVQAHDPPSETVTYGESDSRSALYQDVATELRCQQFQVSLASYVKDRRTS